MRVFQIIHENWRSTLIYLMKKWDRDFFYLIHHLHISHNAPPPILHILCFSFLLGTAVLTKSWKHCFCNMLFTNSKLFRSGYRMNDLCSFCKQEPETINLFFCYCPYSFAGKILDYTICFWENNTSWTNFKGYFDWGFQTWMSLTKLPNTYWENLLMELKNEVFLNIDSFTVSVNIKYETKKNISLLTNNIYKSLEKLTDKWAMS